VFAVNFRQGDVGVTILAGIDEVVVIGGAANSATVVVEKHERKLFDDLLRSQRRKTHRSAIYGAQVRDIGVQVRRRTSLLS